MSWLRRYVSAMFIVSPLCAELFASDLVVLFVTAVLYVAGIVIPWSLCMFLGVTELFGVPVLTPLLAWSWSGIAVVAAWSSLGTGTWHWRFLGACWASLCILTALLGVQNSPLVETSDPPNTLFVQSAVTFACSAFGAQWIASVARVQIRRRPREVAGPRPLRTGQFGIATLLLVIAVIGAGLGAFRIVIELLPVIASLDSPDINLEELSVVIALAGVLPLVAVPAVLNSRTMLVIVAPSVLLVMWVGGFAFGLPTAILGPALFGASVFQLLWLRLCGFRLMRVQHHVDTAVG